jgi:hypothetical protein
MLVSKLSVFDVLDNVNQGASKRAGRVGIHVFFVVAATDFNVYGSPLRAFTYDKLNLVCYGM